MMRLKLSPVSLSHSGSRWRSRLGDEAGGERAHPFRHSKGAADHTRPAKHLGLIEHHTRYAEVVREFAYAAEAQMGRAA